LSLPGPSRPFLCWTLALSMSRPARWFTRAMFSQKVDLTSTRGWRFVATTYTQG